MIIYIDVPVQNILGTNLPKKLPCRTEIAGVTDGNVLFCLPEASLMQILPNDEFRIGLHVRRGC